MIHSHVIIIGGGPAGAACAGELNRKGIECLILDRQAFPRNKLCAGWITPRVLRDLDIDEDEYPHSLTRFNRFHVHIYKKHLTIRVRQYAIRRFEFDQWLLQRSGATVHTHEVRDIRKDNDGFIIDDQYRCRYLVGAGGTHCPVYRTCFKPLYPRPYEHLITTMEEEFHYDYHDCNCHLWFFLNNNPGYAWYVPKGDGHINVGIGGYLHKLKARNDTIKNQWDLFTKELERSALVKNHRFQARGYNYYIRSNVDMVNREGIYLTGDAAGLATRDMGEGIGPAIRSGILAANAIVSGKAQSFRTVKKNSFSPSILSFKLLMAYIFRNIPKISF